MFTLNEIQAEVRRRSLMAFIEHTMPTYDTQPYHRFTCAKIEDWLSGKGKARLMVFMPPQHGKSEISTRRAPAWILGREPKAKVAIAAYNGVIASKFNRDVQRIIDSDEYRQTFPNTSIPAKGVDNQGGYTRNNTEVELIGTGGSLVSVGVGGGLTSRQVDIMIIDDVYKDSKEAWSPVTRANVSEWYSTVVETRLHNDSRVLIVFTRWHEEDLAGELLKGQPDKWDVVKFPAIQNANACEIDPREMGEALWPAKHGLEKLEDIRSRNIVTFENLYQQDPQPSQGLLYSAFKTYRELPEKGSYLIEAYCDSADTGSDYTCSIVYMAQGGLYYVMDVVYTQDGVEVSEGLLATSYIENEVNKATVEANAGGRIFARNVQRVYREQGGVKCQFTTFTQRENKEARIYSNSAQVNNSIIMPEGWANRWPIFYEHVTRFSQVFKKNKHDDCADTLTGIIERGNKGRGSYVTGGSV